MVDTDEAPRAGTTAETLAKLRTAFLRDDGTVTAGNASGLNDGAAAIIVMSASKARERGLRTFGTVESYASVGVEPKIMGIGPVPAVRKALATAGLELGDIDLFELNEAFAAQSLAVLRELDIDPGRINPNGGAIALGHPIGASGGRILVTLLHEMRRRNAGRGLATLCVGGGQGRPRSSATASTRLPHAPRRRARERVGSRARRTGSHISRAIGRADADGSPTSVRYEADIEFATSSWPSAQAGPEHDRTPAAPLYGGRQ